MYSILFCSALDGAFRVELLRCWLAFRASRFCCFSNELLFAALTLLCRDVPTRNNKPFGDVLTILVSLFQLVDMTYQNGQTE